MRDIAVLLPEYLDDERQRYLKNYETIAQDNLATPFEPKIDYRHDVWLKFVGDLRGKRVLDIGSSNALYLRRLAAQHRVAFDLVFTALEAASPGDGIDRVQGDAERLPFKNGFFDVILLSDVLEHVLDAQQVVEEVRRICGPATRVFVHVPWEENLEPYMRMRYEFAHLRYFDAHAFGLLWRGFRIRQYRKTYPNLESPFIFRLLGRIPLALYNRLVERYFFGPGVSDRDYEWRHARSLGLPQAERWLLRMFKPTFMMFELRLRPART